MEPQQETFVRTRLPRGREVFGQVEEVLGGSRFRVNCKDDKIRICKIPGKSKRDFWVNIGDFVLIEPWEIEPNEKGDIIFRYTRTQVEWLRRKGIIKQ
ncbi:MAG TPA: translation initiation factor eIF-1A [archaeon]|nr:translation initiation factor eIF-1A [archaeon]